MSVAALIVAAGRGARAVSETGRPKQYCRIGGVPMITRSIGAFATHPSVGDILVVIHPDDAALYEAASGQFAGRLRKAVPDAPGEVSKPYLPKGIEYRNPTATQFSVQ